MTLSRAVLPERTPAPAPCRGMIIYSPSRSVKKFCMENPFSFSSRGAPSVLLLDHVLYWRWGLRLVVLHVVEVLRLGDHRLAVAGDGHDGGIQDDGQQAAGKAVVIEGSARPPQCPRTVLPPSGGTPAQHAVGPAEVARDGSQGSPEQMGQLDGAAGDRGVITKLPRPHRP